MTQNSLSSMLTKEDMEAALEGVDAYIRLEVQKYVPRHMIPSGDLDMIIDELVQMVRIKLWMALKQRPIHNYRAYSRVIVRSEVINMLRKDRQHCPLPIDEEGEFSPGTALLFPNEEIADPAQEVEKRETMQQCLATTVKAIQKLPHRQQQAIVCLLKERLDDTLALTETFAKYGMDVEEIFSSKDEDVSRLRASLSIARKKLQVLRKQYS